MWCCRAYIVAGPQEYERHSIRQRDHLICIQRIIQTYIPAEITGPDRLRRQHYFNTGVLDIARIQILGGKSG